jgi:hypothetical protein
MMELVEPKLDVALRNTVRFKVKIVAGNPGIIKQMRLGLTQGGAVKAGPFEMWYVESSPPHTEAFWYAEVDAGRIPDGRYNLKITAYDSKDNTVAELDAVVEVGQVSTIGAFRDWFAWLGTLLAISSAVAYWRRI